MGFGVEVRLRDERRNSAFRVFGVHRKSCLEAEGSESRV